jgi:hypothetical protein
MANFDTFPDPTVPGDPIPGDAIPVSLITHPFAKQIANVATGGKFSFTDGDMHVLDLFHTFHPSASAGVAVVVLNSLTTPLTLVDSYKGHLDDYNNGPQLSYPAVLDATTQEVTTAHQIPGVRIYPRPSQHKDASGNPVLVGGVGLYRFQASKSVNLATIATRGLAFACTDDGSNKSPLIGVAFSYWNQVQTPLVISCAVTTDLSKQGQADTQSNLKALIGKAQGKGVPYDVGTGGNSMTVWGVIAPGSPIYEPQMTVIVVWVRDVSSTFGY